MAKSKSKIKVECKFCGKTFEALRSSSKFCGTNCRVKSHNLKKKSGRKPKTETAVALIPKSEAEVEELKLSIESQQHLIKHYQEEWVRSKEDFDDFAKELNNVSDKFELQRISIETEEEKAKALYAEIVAIDKELQLKDNLPKSKQFGLIETILSIDNTMNKHAKTKKRNDLITTYNNLVEDIQKKREALSKRFALVLKMKIELGQKKKIVELYFKQCETASEEKRKLTTQLENSSGFFN